jgi:predicted transcriptional regulator
MQIINSSNSKDQSINFSMLPEIPDNTGCKIIMSITDISKTVSQICREYDLPQSSTYKKVKSLLKAGLITIERISIDEKGKRIVFYKSKIKSLEINLKAGNIAMKYNTDDINLQCDKF